MDCKVPMKLSSSLVVKGLLALRSLLEVLWAPKRRHRWSQKVTLHTLSEGGFGLLAEAPGQEVVLGITGRF